MWLGAGLALLSWYQQPIVLPLLPVAAVAGVPVQFVGFEPA